MPTYEYRCSACRHELEAFQKMSDAPLTKCPQCSQEALKRLIGGKNAILNFKGSGFYITDYSKENPSTSKDSSPKET